MKQLSKHLTFANAISCIALFVALSGAAYAAKTTLGSKAVKTQNLANSSVTTIKLRGSAVTAPKIRNGTVTRAKIAPGAIGATQIADGAVRSVALGGGVVTEGKLKDGAVTGSKLASSVLAQFVKNISYVSKTSPTDASNPKSATAECPSGKQAIGGGVRTILGDALKAFPVGSLPFIASEGRRTGWTASGETTEAGKTFAVEAVAVCAEF